MSKSYATASQGESRGTPPPRILEVVVAVHDVVAAAERLGAAFAAPAAALINEHTPGIEIKMTSLELSGARLGLIQDATGSGPVARSIARRGEGLYSVIIEVPDLRVAMQRMAALGVEFVSEDPVVLRDADRDGRRFSRILIAWTRPQSTHGVLIEFQERQRDQQA